MIFRLYCFKQDRRFKSGVRHFVLRLPHDFDGDDYISVLQEFRDWLPTSRYHCCLDWQPTLDAVKEVI